MTPAEVEALLGRLGPDLDALEAPWAIAGSGALLILGLPVDDCPDLDILTTVEGAARLETAWAGWREAGYAPDPAAPFRSRFSRYRTPEGAAEVMGDLKRPTPDGWRRVEAGRVERTPFGGRRWPVPSGPDQLRILREFGRPKDLAKAERLEAWLAGR